MRHMWLLWGQSLIERGAWFFAPVSWIWALFVICKNYLYRRGYFAVEHAGCPVVSVGNIVAGGTGKTPFVHLLAKTFSHRKVAILSRGYGVIPDEALLLARKLPQVKIYIGKNRAALSRQAVQEGAELILLDDGFQHRKLHRDFDIVLVRRDDPFGKGHFLPWGFLRDHPKRLFEADAIFASDRDFQLIPTRTIQGEGQVFGLFCGIGNPHSFKKTVDTLGLKVVAEWILADHEPADLSLLTVFIDRCKLLNVSAIVTTEKDFIKLPKDFQTTLPILPIEVELQMTKGQKKWEKLIAKIDQKIDNRPNLWLTR